VIYFLYDDEQPKEVKMWYRVTHDEGKDWGNWIRNLEESAGIKVEFIHEPKGHHVGGFEDIDAPWDILIEVDEKDELDFVVAGSYEILGEWEDKPEKLVDYMEAVKQLRKKQNRHETCVLCFHWDTCVTCERAYEEGGPWPVSSNPVHG
jgi:hypothetical protein